MAGAVYCGGGAARDEWIVVVGGGAAGVVLSVGVFFGVVGVSEGKWMFVKNWIVFETQEESFLKV